MDSDVLQEIIETRAKATSSGNHTEKSFLFELSRVVSENKKMRDVLNVVDKYINDCATFKDLENAMSSLQVDFK